MEQAGKKARQSNLELLRIICIVAIIADHFIGQNNIPEHTSFLTSGFYVILNSLSRVGCSVFIIISAWFSVDMPFRSKKFVHIWLTVAMFSLPFLLWQLPRSVFDAVQMQSMAYPVEGTPLWFAGYYLVLMCLSPLLNLLIQKGSRRLVEYVLFFFGAAMTLYTTVTAELGFFSNEIWPLVFLYILTGYWKKYLQARSKARKWFLISWGAVCVCRIICCHLPGGVGSALFSKYMEAYRARMQTIPNLITAFSLFFLFYNMKIKSYPVINRIAGFSLGVYCFHQLPGWYRILWDKVLNAPFHTENLHGLSRMAYTIAGIIAIWIMGSVAEYIRAKAAGILIEDRKWFNRVSQRVDRIVNGEETVISPSERRLILCFVVLLILWFLITPVLFSSQLYMVFRP